MKTVGDLLKAARDKNEISLSDLSKHTRIKEEFILYIEQNQWDKLPELPVLTGFVKSISDVLQVNKDQSVALLRRDYTTKKSTTQPVQEIKYKAFRVTPQLIFGSLLLLIVFLLGGYLVSQYTLFVRPPMLEVVSPIDNELVATGKIVVRGNTNASSVVRINGQLATVEDNGVFVAEIEVVPEVKSLLVKATSRSGKETTIERRIEVKDTK